MPLYHVTLERTVKETTTLVVRAENKDQIADNLGKIKCEAEHADWDQTSEDFEISDSFEAKVIDFKIVLAEDPFIDVDLLEETSCDEDDDN